MGKYAPINCGLYDHLEHFITKKETVKLTYLEEGVRKTVHEQIVDLGIENKAEFATLSNKTKIRLDNILFINDIAFGLTC